MSLFSPRHTIDTTISELLNIHRFKTLQRWVGLAATEEPHSYRLMIVLDVGEWVAYLHKDAYGKLRPEIREGYVLYRRKTE
jgi:hypothetical protein